MPAQPPALSSAAPDTRRRFTAVMLAPVLVFVALMAWAFASPMGASPDDDYHLISAWCATGDESHCAPGSDETHRVVPAVIHGSDCYTRTDASAACLARYDLGGTRTVDTDRGNFQGAYPPVFYFVNGLFVGDDVLTSVVVMRTINVLLFVGFGLALFLLLPTHRRPTLVWGWLITTMPVGVSLIASNNPSGWAITGVGAAWLALLGYLETTGRRRIGLGIVFALATLVAGGARADAATYIVIAIAAVLVLTFRFTRAYLLSLILPAAMALVSVFFFLSTRQISSGVGGFGGGGAVSSGAGAETAVTGFALHAFNLLNMPTLFAGMFGSWGLGWFDTPLPTIVTYAGIAVFVAAGFVGLGKLDARKAIVIVGGVLVVWLLPAYVLGQGGHTVGLQVQPRYILPLVVVLAGVLLLASKGREVRFTRVQRIVLVGSLAVANFVALQTSLSRYVTDGNGGGVDLDADVDWWWPGLPFSPNAVWIVGALAYAAAATLLVRHISRVPAVTPISSAR